MQKTNVLTQVLAIVGTSLVWFPLLVTILFSLFFFVTEQVVHLDYLIPAELFPVALLGGVLLLWAAVRARLRVRLIFGGVVVAAATLAVGMAIAVATGLASGETDPGGWQQALVLVFLAANALALAVTGIGGILLMRDLFFPRGPPASSDASD
jgi:hypothetical protein